jgi:hypothetical protein
MDRRGLVAAGTVALALATGGCGASSEGNGPATTPTPRDCRSLTFPYPTPDATLTGADAGKTVHIPVGGLVEVDLLGSPSRRWSPLILTGTGVISLSTQAETPTVGTRLGEYCAVGEGTASLSATDGSVQWSADIVVP